MQYLAITCNLAVFVFSLRMVMSNIYVGCVNINILIMVVAVIINQTMHVSLFHYVTQKAIMTFIKHKQYEYHMHL